MAPKRITVFWGLSAAIVLLDALFIATNYFLSHKTLLHDLTKEAQGLHAAFQASLDDTAKNLVITASVIANDSQVEQLFLQGKRAVEAEGGGPGKGQAAAARDALYDLVAPRWHDAMHLMGARQLHFHLGPGSLSFLRVHRPRKFGDRMDDVRHIIVDTNRDHQVRRGFETGRVYSGIRGVVPVFANDAELGERVYVGALESGTSFENIVNSFDQATGTHVTVLLSQEHIHSAMWPSFIEKRFTTQLTSCGCVVEATSAQLPPVLLAQAPRYRDKFIKNGKVNLVRNAKAYLAESFFPLRDYLGSQDPGRADAGAVLLWSDVTEQILGFQKNQWINALYAVIAFLVIEALLYLGFRKTTEHLEREIAYRANELSDNERRWHYALDSASDGLWDWDVAGNTVFYSPTWKSMLGCRDEEIGDDFDEWRERIHPDDLNRFDEELGRHLSGRAAAFQIEHRLLHKEGTFKWILARGKTMAWGPQHNSLRIIGTLTDITAHRELEAELLHSNELLEEAQRIGALGHWDWDVQADTLAWSDQVCRIFGVPPQSFGANAQAFYARIHPHDLQQVQNAVAETLQSGVPYAIDHRILLGDGEIRHVHEQAELIRDDAGRPLRMIGTVHDITDRKRAEEEIAEQHRFLQSVINGVADPILVIDPDYNVLMMNDAARVNAPDEQFEKCRKCHCISHHSNTPCPEEDQPCPLKEVLETRKAAQVIHNHPSPSGGERVYELVATPLFKSDGTLRCVIETSRDITAHQVLLNQLKENEGRLQHIAHHDPLTGLPNRLLFVDRLQQSIHKAKRARKLIALLFIDLDRFKEINDSFGHPTGDKLLILVAKRLQEKIREQDTIARIGGDEFTVIIDEMDRAEEAGVVAEKLLHTFKQPFEVDQRTFFLTTSIGISIYPADGRDADTLVRNADSAMYNAKDQGRNAYQYYAAEMTAHAFEHIMMETRLRTALEKDELLLHYQPQVDMRTGQPVGIEALVRWNHPEMGLIAPAKFIPLAEDTGLILPIGEWILKRACQQAQDWVSRGLCPGRISINCNLSGRQLGSELFHEAMQCILQDVGMEPNLLELEITETTVMKDTEHSALVMNGLRAIGIKLAIDDFGTGYSSLSYLKTLPISKLKIDRSFVKDIPDDTNDAAITQAIIALGNSLQLEVIAEGVETEEQSRFLLREGCHMAQGFLYSRPLPPEEFEEYLMEKFASGDAAPPPALG